MLMAYITDGNAVTKILKHLGLPATPQPLAPARLAAQLDLFDLINEVADGDDGDDGAPRPSPCARGQPSRAPPATMGEEWIAEIDEPDQTGHWGA